MTGYISDFEGSKGTYRIVVTAVKKGETDDKTKEETIYDHTINRIDGVVENEERYSQGVDLSAVNAILKKRLKSEYNIKVDTLAEERYKKDHPDVRRVNAAQKKTVRPAIEKELAEKGEAIVELPIDRDKLKETNFKKEINFKSTYATVANDLNNELKKMKDTDVQKSSPIWLDTSEPSSDNPDLLKSRDPDRVYKLLDFILPTAKKIIYHGDTDQLELITDPVKVTKHRAELEKRLKEKEDLFNTTMDETQKTKLNQEISGLKLAIGSTNAYTYMEARNGKEAKILGSNMYATRQPDKSELTEDEYNKIRTNKLALEAQDGSKKFTLHFVEKDNVSRDGVISDEKLSEEITKAINNDKENLGKGGYFSTGDIPLDKDVIAYKIQVFAENKKRGGVNTLSSRLQYNLPILADFSVIQDTVEPSRTVVEKIIPKLNIPEEEKKQITEEIKKKKKTSELADLISGNVKVRYVDEQGHLLSLKNDTGIGEKESDGTYITNKKQLIGTSYNVTDKKLSTISTTNGKHYRAKRDLGENSDPTEGNIVNGVRTITYVYEEREAPTTATVTANYYKEGTQEKLAESVVKADLAIGSEYTTEAKVIEGKTTTEDKEDRVITRKTTYTLVATPENATGTVPEDGATVDYYYRENVEETVVPKTATTTETKTITRTIHYVDKVTNQNVKEDVVQPVTLSRTKTENKVTGVVTYGEWTTGNWDEVVSGKIDKYKDPDIPTVESQEVTSDSSDNEITVRYDQDTATSTETKTITRTIHYVDKVTNQTVKEDVVQPVILSRTKTENKVTGVVTYGEWTRGNWDEVVSPEIANYGKPDLPTVSNEEVTADSKDTTILVRYDRLSTPNKPIPEKPEIPNPQEPGTPGEPTPDKPNPQPNPEHPSVPTPSPELPNQETPIPEPTPEPDTPKPETPVSPDPEVPTYETGKREELPNTGTEANADLAGAGLLTLLAGLGLGFFKKKEDEK